MNQVRRFLGARLSHEATDVRIVELGFHGAALAVLVLGLVGVARMAGTPGEVLIGALVTCLASLQLVVAGVVVAPALSRPRS
jgi:hypothetical protein